MTGPARSFTGPALRYAADNARLPLTAERRDILGPVLDQIYGLIDSLDAIPLGEVPPATAFDARWE